MSHYPPSFQACRLFKKTSANGNTYYTGRWGGARVTLLKSRETADDGGEIWNLMLSEAPAKAQTKPGEDRWRPPGRWETPFVPRKRDSSFSDEDIDSEAANSRRRGEMTPGP
jgi:hypothetical protein